MANLNNILTVIIFCLNCSKEEMTLNQIGKWEGIRMEQIISETNDTMYFDTIDVSIELLSDFTGKYNNRDIYRMGKRVQ